MNNLWINVSSKGKDDKKLFDVYVSLKDMKDEQLMIEIYSKQTLADLHSNIRQLLESKYEHLNGLKGLRISEIIATS